MRKGKLEQIDKIGKITILNRTEKKDKYGNYLWKCQCECGEIFVRSSVTLLSSLRNNKNVMCSHCLKKEKEKNTFYTQRKHCIYPPGYKYSYITVISYDKLQKKYLCQCKCGNQTYKSASTIVASRYDNKVLSCGCIKNLQFQNIRNENRKRLSKKVNEILTDPQFDENYVCLITRLIKGPHYYIRKNRNCVELSFSHGEKIAIGIPVENAEEESTKFYNEFCKPIVDKYGCYYKYQNQIYDAFKIWKKDNKYSYEYIAECTGISFNKIVTFASKRYNYPPYFIVNALIKMGFDISSIIT